MQEIRDIIFVEDGKEVGKLMPMHLYGESNCATACGYHFITIEGIHYFVVHLETSEFCFNKYYAMDSGLNQELWDMLLDARAVRLTDGKIDFMAVMMYVFNFDAKPIRNANGFLVYNLRIQQESYNANINAFNKKDSVLKAVIEEQEQDSKSLL